MARILVVDDSAVMRHFLISSLYEADHTVLEAADGAAGFEIACAERPDLIITDILMPVMDGFEFARRLRGSPAVSHIPVIFHTATYREPQAKTLAAACRVRTLIPKPCEPQVILAAVNKELGLAPGGKAAAPSAMMSRPDDARPRALEDKLASYVREMNDLKATFDRLASKFSGLVEDGQSLSDVSSKFSANLVNLQRFGSRLAMIIEATLEMRAEQGVANVLRQFFDAACAIIGSHYAAIAVYDSDRNLEHVYCKGFDANVFLASPGPRSRAPELLLAQNPKGCVRLTETDRDIEGFPDGHPPVRGFLGALISSRGHSYGWLYFAERLGRAEFSNEDERILATLAAHIAAFYESARAFDLLQQHATNLQMELVKRDT